MFLCKELHFSAAAVEVMNSDKLSHLLSIIPGGKFEFYSRQQKRFFEKQTMEWNFISILIWNSCICLKKVMCQVSLFFMWLVLYIF